MRRSTVCDLISDCWVGNMQSNFKRIRRSRGLFSPTSKPFQANSKRACPRRPPSPSVCVCVSVDTRVCACVPLLHLESAHTVWFATGGMPTSEHRSSNKLLMPPLSPPARTAWRYEGSRDSFSKIVLRANCAALCPDEPWPSNTPETPQQCHELRRLASHE